MKRVSIKTAILIPVLSVLIVGIIIMVIVVGMVTSAATTDLTDNLVDARVNEYTNEFRVMSRDAYAVVRSLAPTVDELRQSSVSPRERIAAILESVLSSNEEAVAVWACFEPNALDGRDSDYVNANEYHDGTGRFVPYVFRDGNSIAYEPLAGYTDPVEGAIYQSVKDSGKPYISDPYEYSAGGTTIIMYSICFPVLENGEAIGAVGIDINVEALAAVMNAGAILDDGNLSVISPGGLFTTSRTAALVLSDYKSIWLNQFSSEIDNVLANGGSFSGVGYSDVLGVDVQVLISGVMIGDTGRYWGICGLVPMDNITAASTSLLLLVIGIGVALIAVVGLMTFFLISRRLRNLPVITAMAEKISVGDVSNIDTDLSTTRTKNEITLLERAFGAIAGSIKRQSEIMEKIAEGDYSVSVSVRSDADIMNKAIGDMLEKTNATLDLINSSAAQVSTGANQVANGAQALAQGATEQAASIQELSGSIAEIAERTKHNAEMAGHASQLAGTIKDNAEKGSRQMGEMMAAVKDINQSGQDIGKVIKVIDEIAFQTNILALNAAVEAARAGQHGKGFAVVAEEVRNLAAKSAEAAKDTESLIANSMQKSEMGVKIADETAASLSEIVSGIGESSQLVSEIAESSDIQSVAISQINTGIDQVAHVVQQNSATSEESAAASEEMSSQSTLLQELISQFKLKRM